MSFDFKKVAKAMRNWRDTIQHILWAIAGAERKTLDECPTDHNKFAAIGATIMMTAVIAFFAGASAAWYFSQSGNEKSGSILGSIVFGLLWATLIFTIDRSLVITLKKNPTLKRQKWCIPFFSRLALAILIAFMVSIPLELYVFNDLIESASIKWKNDDAASTGQSTSEYKENLKIDSLIVRDSKRIDRYDSLIDKNNGKWSDKDKEYKQLENEIGHPDSEEFKKAKKLVDEKNREVSKLKLQKQKIKERGEDTAAIQLQLGKEEYNLKNARISKNTAAANWNNPRISKRAQIKKEMDSIGNLVSRYEKNSMSIDSSNTVLTGVRNSNDTIIKNTEKLQHAINNKSNNFILNFRILDYAVKQEGHEWDRVFLWLIRLLFLIIEIMPTVVKIVTPVGAYDWRIHSEEEQLSNYLQTDEFAERIKELHQIELDAKKKLLEEQHNIESELKIKIIEKMKEAQIDVAEEAIAQWKERQYKKIWSNNESTGDKPPVV